MSKYSSPLAALFAGFQGAVPGVINNFQEMDAAKKKAQAEEELLRMKMAADQSLSRNRDLGDTLRQYTQVGTPQQLTGAYDILSGQADPSLLAGAQRMTEGQDVVTPFSPDVMPAIDRLRAGQKWIGGAKKPMPKPAGNPNNDALKMVRDVENDARAEAVAQSPAIEKLTGQTPGGSSYEAELKRRQTQSRTRIAFQRMKVLLDRNPTINELRSKYGPDNIDPSIYQTMSAQPSATGTFTNTGTGAVRFY